MAKYYTDQSGVIFFEPINTEGMTPILIPIAEDGTPLHDHENLVLLELDTNGNQYEYYLQTIDSVSGTYKPDTIKIGIKVTEGVRLAAKTTRDEALQANTYTLTVGGIGYVYQVRPQDLPNFDITIAGGIDEEWVLADNSVRLTTIAELQEIMSAGIIQGKTIWNTYKTTIKGL